MRVKRKAPEDRRVMKIIGGADEEVRARAKDYAQRLNGLDKATRFRANCIG